MTDRNPWPSHSTRPARDEVEPGIPATSEMPRDIPPGSEDEEEPAPREFPQGVEEWGTTSREEQLGEPFELRVRREEPDVVPGAGDPVEARGVSLLEPGTDAGIDDGGGFDAEPDAIGELNLERAVTMSPEEQALRIEDEPDGLNYDPGPGYLDETEGAGGS